MQRNVYLIHTGITDKRVSSTSGLGLSLIPAVIYSQVFAQRFLGVLTPGMRIMATIAFIAAYMVLSQMRYVCIGFAVANTIMYVGMIWVLMDKIQPVWLAWAFKVAVAIAFILVEIGTCYGIMGNNFRSNHRKSK